VSALALDRVAETRAERLSWATTRATEREYVARLRQIARHIGDLVNGVYDGTAASTHTVAAALQRYADTISPWAEATARRMLQDAQRRDERTWVRHANRISRLLGAEVRRAPVAAVIDAMVREQVGLIRSLPLEAAQRVQDLALEGVVRGRRWTEVESMILDTHQVTRSRATLIARTESSRARTAISAARAQYVGSEGYIWRTARDADVRRFHKRLEGTFHRWDDPPIAEVDGKRHHPGEFPNCRCWTEPTLPHDIV
jgi:SPP1 gp7 family putative phage head morphogenesis protein